MTNNETTGEGSVFSAGMINAQLKRLQQIENENFNAGIDAAIKVVVHDNSGPHYVTDEIKLTKERIIRKLKLLKRGTK